ncbi:DUF6005 family protein [Acuticoccus yangtzensis]|uniref:DUF6005 family protein n=1 Tax=Acuticoccus yangtzensis TaxID=1443441 RepID=UPI000949722C|nr:DUF6005 family protein [Acuticoccus yangtzensis]
MTPTLTAPPTRERVIAAVETVLRDRLANRYMAKFGPDAALGRDLALDSLMTMNLLLHLETDHGLVAPDSAIATRAAETVAEFAGLFLAQPDEAPPATPTAAPRSAPDEAAKGEGVHGEDYVEIKVHCFISCVADAIKRVPGLDHRPLFFGVWDAPFIATDEAIRYHEPGMDQEFFRAWSERLYGLRIHPWYDAGLTKAANIAVMRRLLTERTGDQDVMVMLDMYHLPERENLLRKNPFPHFLLLELTDDPDVLLMRDVDYRWEGPMARETVERAIDQPSVAGGYLVDRSAAVAPSAADLSAYFEATFEPRHNRLIDAVRRIVDRCVAHGDVGGLANAVADLPLLSVRKYGYEHGFAFFWRVLQRDTESFEVWCDEIEALIQGMRTLNFELLKLSHSGEPARATVVYDLLDQLDARERTIKDAMAATYAAWQTSGRPVTPARPATP